MKTIVKNKLTIIILLTITLIAGLNSCVKHEYDPGDPPVLTSIEPDEAYLGDSIILKGSNLKEVIVVMIGNRKLDTSCFKYQNNTNNEIRVKIPANADTGMVYVEVINKAGYSRKQMHIKRRIIPRIVSFTPTTGMPGDTVKVLGFDFYGINKVEVGDKEADFVVVDPNNIKVILPQGITGGKGKITIYTNYGNVESQNEIVIARYVLIIDHDGGGISGLSWSSYGAVSASSVEILAGPAPYNNYLRFSTDPTSTLHYAGVQLRANVDQIPTRLGLTKDSTDRHKVELKISLKADRNAVVQVLVAYGPNGTDDNFNMVLNLTTKWTEYTINLSEMRLGYGNTEQSYPKLIIPKDLEWIKVAPQSAQYYPNGGYSQDDPVTIYVDNVYFVEYE